jgi:hypothetical protein
VKLTEQCSIANRNESWLIDFAFSTKLTGFSNSTNGNENLLIDLVQR